MVQRTSNLVRFYPILHENRFNPSSILSSRNNISILHSLELRTRVGPCLAITCLYLFSHWRLVTFKSGFVCASVRLFFLKLLLNTFEREVLWMQFIWDLLWYKRGEEEDKEEEEEEETLIGNSYSLQTFTPKTFYLKDFHKI